MKSPTLAYTGISRFTSCRTFEEPPFSALNSSWRIFHPKTMMQKSTICSAANSVCSRLQASLATAPAEHRATLAAIVDSIGQGFKPSEMGKLRND